MTTRWNPAERSISGVDQPQHGRVRGAVRPTCHHGQRTVPGGGDRCYYNHQSDDNGDFDDFDGVQCKIPIAVFWIELPPEEEVWTRIHHPHQDSSHW